MTGPTGRKLATFVTVLAVLSSTAMACSPAIPPGQERVTLITGGYGYEVGDIVLMDTVKEPSPGDVVQYDWNPNKSSCGGFGPGIYLARLIAGPGDNVTFGPDSYSANGYTGAAPPTGPVMWGTTRLEGAANTELSVPGGEFLADKRVGYECTGETDATGSSKFYGRFTVKQEAIRGVILKKVGHDREFAEKQKGVVY